MLECYELFDAQSILSSARTNLFNRIFFVNRNKSSVIFPNICTSPLSVILTYTVELIILIIVSKVWKIVLENGNRSVDGEQKKTRKPVSYFSTSPLIFATSIYRVNSSILASFLNIKGSRALLDRVQSQSRSRFDYAGKLLKRLNLEASA